MQGKCNKGKSERGCGGTGKEEGKRKLPASQPAAAGLLVMVYRGGGEGERGRGGEEEEGRRNVLHVLIIPNTR